MAMISSGRKAGVLQGLACLRLKDRQQVSHVYVFVEFGALLRRYRAPSGLFREGVHSALLLGFKGELKKRPSGFRRETVRVNLGEPLEHGCSDMFGATRADVGGHKFWIHRRLGNVWLLSIPRTHGFRPA